MGELLETKTSGNDFRWSITTAKHLVAVFNAYVKECTPYLIRYLDGNCDVCKEVTTHAINA
ncbi:hypothetical protein Tcan_09286 [Toxocara canis]|uniref:Uncharacterized protein n=1 Tax=Toxocara canis TaxID=6265 RepID=A0A0B2V5C3_TOXCA|nr:hypothetical protein Tcan_09286 [Toxocara canis]